MVLFVLLSLRINALRSLPSAEAKLIPCFVINTFHTAYSSYILQCATKAPDTPPLLPSYPYQ